LSSITHEARAHRSRARDSRFALDRDVPAIAELGSVVQQDALIRVASLIIDGAAQQTVFEALARELGVLTHAVHVRLARYEPDGSAPTVGIWSAQPAATSVAIERRILLHCRARTRAWGEVTLTEPPFGLSDDVEATVLGFTRLVSPAIASAETRQALDEARERSVRAADRVRADIAEQLQAGPRRQLVEVSRQLAEARAEVRRDRGRTLVLIGTARAALSAGMEELQQLASGIHPTLLSERGLDPALENLADACPVRVSVNGRVGRRLAEPSELAAYYVIEGALRSSADHACVTSITVNVRVEGGVLRLEVADDAVGDVRDTIESRDLLEVRDRLIALGGELTVGSASFGGMAVSARLPASSDG